MKKRYLCYGLAIGLVGGATLRIFPVGAAPIDVHGSANVAVDYYQNALGTFKLMSNGGIYVVSSGNATVAALAGTDLGNSYAPATTGFLSLPPQISTSPKPPVGSSNVAIKAMPRAEGTFVLFQDGSIKIPASSYAAAGAATPARIFSVVTQDYAASSPMQDGYNLTFPASGTPIGNLVFTKNTGMFTVTLAQPLTGNSSAIGAVTIFNSQHGGGLIESISLPGRISGNQVTFSLNGTFGYQYNVNQDSVLYFTASFTSD